jgi:hypothetical protein
MSSHTPACRAPAELAQAIERHIVERTWGRVRRLGIDVQDDRVYVHGNTPSYYVKQLAIQAVRDVLGEDEPIAIRVDIEVGDDACAARS